ncbi:hypothetical protein JAB6_49520 [Janthinobacterium sp. HH104]|nr:hypothetical protein JAB6_49520 [Janthinobacterium sp. HH104]
MGSRIRRRRYDSEVPGLIDQPLNGATQLRIYAATPTPASVRCGTVRRSELE